MIPQAPQSVRCQQNGTQILKYDGLTGLLLHMKWLSREKPMVNLSLQKNMSYDEPFKYTFAIFFANQNTISVQKKKTQDIAVSHVATLVAVKNNPDL